MLKIGIAHGKRILMINRIKDNQFKLVSKYQPSGDQPQAIEQLLMNIEGGEKAQILMGDGYREDLYHESGQFPKSINQLWSSPTIKL